MGVGLSLLKNVAVNGRLEVDKLILVPESELGEDLKWPRLRLHEPLPRKKQVGGEARTPSDALGVARSARTVRHNHRPHQVTRRLGLARTQSDGTRAPISAFVERFDGSELRSSPVSVARVTPLLSTVTSTERPGLVGEADNELAAWLMARTPR